jgi:hypothetical protein
LDAGDLVVEAAALGDAGVPELEGLLSLMQPPEP